MRRYLFLYRMARDQVQSTLADYPRYRVHTLLQDGAWYTLLLEYEEYNG